MIDDRARARPPGRAGMDLEQVARLLAAEFEGVAALDQADAFRGQPLQLDRADFGAVLLLLAPALVALVAVEVALQPVELAVKQVDDAPEQGFEIGLEAGDRAGRAAFMAIIRPGAGRVGTPTPWSNCEANDVGGRSAAKDGKGRLFCLALQSRAQARRRKIAARRRCLPGPVPARSPP